MIWPFLSALLFVIFAWSSMYNIAFNFLMYCFSTILFVIFTAVAFGVGLGFASLIGLAVPKHWTGPERAKLVSLRDGDGISGAFFLGTGSIGTTQYYFFYKDAERGGTNPGRSWSPTMCWSSRRSGKLANSRLTPISS